MIRIVCCFGVWVDGGVVGRAIGGDERNEDSRDAFFHLITPYSLIVLPFPFPQTAEKLGPTPDQRHRRAS